MDRLADRIAGPTIAIVGFVIFVAAIIWGVWSCLSLMTQISMGG